MNSTSQTREEPSQILVGPPDNFWLWSPALGWDLTHSVDHKLKRLINRLHVRCDVSNVSIDPAKTALLIIDMQNFSLSPLLNPDLHPDFQKTQQALLEYGIPAARKAKIQVIWLNWGLEEEDLASMPPNTLRVFGWRANSCHVDYELSAMPRCDQGIRRGIISCGETQRGTGLGQDLGYFRDVNGSEIQAGRTLMKDTWNAAIYGPLHEAYQQGSSAEPKDMLIHKNRNSGLWHSQTECYRFLEQQGIRTLLLAGMNTDQCVMGTLQDAHARGFDTILLRDGCVTDSPSYAQESAEFNCCRNWGFLSSCENLAMAVDYGS